MMLGRLCHHQVGPVTRQVLGRAKAVGATDYALLGARSALAPS